tara:strand:- start:50 stop:220 length:171 start_codon:yes stop_codon:yes gene_type:complete
MTKEKKILKKNKKEWKEHKWIFEGYRYIMVYNKSQFQIIHEPTGRTITKGEFNGTA